MRRVVESTAPWELAARLRADAERVVTPGGAAARWLGVPACALTDLAAERLARERIHPAGAPLEARVLRAAVRRLVSNRQPERMARVVEESVHRLLRTDADLAAVGRLPGRLGELGRLAAAVEADLRRRRRVAAAGAIRAALRLEVAPRRLLVYGYPRLDAVEVAFLDRCAGDGSVIILPAVDGDSAAEPRRVAELLAARGWHAEPTAERAGGPALAYQRFGDPEAEVRGALRQVKALLTDGVPAREIVLISRDEQRYGPVVAAVAAEYGLAVRPRYPLPLRETRLGGWLSLLIEAVAEELPFETTLQLVGSPLAGEATDFGHARRERWSGDDWLRLPRPWLPAALRPFSRPPAEWSAWLGDLLAVAGVHHRLRWWPRELLAFETFGEALAELAQETGTEPVPFAAWSAEVAAVLDLLTVDADPGRGGVALHTPLAVYGARYRHGFVLGTVAGGLPATVGDDPYLDYAGRAELATHGVRLETAAEAARREWLSVGALMLAVSERLTFCAPAQLDGKPTVASPLVGRLGLVETGAPAIAASAEERLVGGLESSATTAAVAGRRALAIERRRESAEPADGFDGVVGGPIDPGILSFHQLLDLGRCPFSWLARHRWRLSEPEEEPAEPHGGRRSRVLRGALSLTLRAVVELEVAGEAEAWARLLPDALELAVGGDIEGTTPERAALLRAAAQAEPPPDEIRRLTGLRHWPLVGEEWLDTVRRAVTDVDVWLAEAQPTDRPPSAVVDWHGLRVRLRVDRIDVLPDGSTAAVIYRDSSGKGPPSGVQGPEGKLNVLLEPVLCEHLHEATKTVWLNLRGPHRASKDAVASEASEAVGGIIAGQLAEGRFPVRPDRGLAACRSCRLELLCRVGPRVERKREAEP